MKIGSATAVISAGDATRFSIALFIILIDFDKNWYRIIPTHFCFVTPSFLERSGVKATLYLRA
jgi:hypothetical protein